MCCLICSLALEESSPSEIVEAKDVTTGGIEDAKTFNEQADQQIYGESDVLVTSPVTPSTAIVVQVAKNVTEVDYLKKETAVNDSETYESPSESNVASSVYSIQEGLADKVQYLTNEDEGHTIHEPHRGIPTGIDLHGRITLTADTHYLSVMKGFHESHLAHISSLLHIDVERAISKFNLFSTVTVEDITPSLKDSTSRRFLLGTNIGQENDKRIAHQNRRYSPMVAPEYLMQKNNGGLIKHVSFDISLFMIDDVGSLDGKVPTEELEVETVRSIRAALEDSFGTGRFLSSLTIKDDIFGSFQDIQLKSLEKINHVVNEAMSYSLSVVILVVVVMAAIVGAATGTMLQKYLVCKRNGYHIPSVKYDDKLKTSFPYALPVSGIHDIEMGGHILPANFQPPPVVI